MARPGMQWRHIVFCTHNSWLPGDPRGFRNKKHRIHSSGDYKNPPPAGEHAGLFQHAKKISGEPVVIPKELQERMGRAMLAELQKQDCTVLAIAVAANHVHILVEMPKEPTKYRAIVGRCKTAACYAGRTEMPGRIWGRNATYKPIKDQQHQRNTYRYVLNQKDAWTWSFRQQDDEESSDKDVAEKDDDEEVKEGE
jgi:REP element-mobilizing transposase RayT